MHINKKFLGLGVLVAIVLAMIGIGLSAGAASAHGDDHEVSGKPVTVCHQTGSRTNPYVKLDNVPLVQFIGPNGHANHSGDIWAPFSYVVRDSSETWHTVNVDGQGDQSLLAFEDCKKPKTDTQITKPEVVFNDACGTSNDTFSVAPGEGYTVGAVHAAGNQQEIIVTLNEGFTWPDGDHAALTFDRPNFTDVDCGLPDTGSTEVATTTGYLAAGSVAALALALSISVARRNKQNN